MKKYISLGLLLVAAPLLVAQERWVELGSDGWALWLDRKAEWKNDKLFLPPVDVTTLTVSAPSCGWDKLFANVKPEADVEQVVADEALSLAVQVPGTVEEFYWDALSDEKGAKKGLGHSGDYKGVSWWGRGFNVPAEAKGKRVKLAFTGGIRQRAEIFVNRKLVGYELVHQTSFEVDVTDAVNYGADNQLAVRITDAGGNFSWGDFTGQLWGDYYFPLSHGFGGILGKVALKVVNPAHVADVFVKNKPSLRDIDADIEIANEGAAEVSGSVSVEIVEAWQNGSVASPKTVATLSGGEFKVGAGKSVTVSVPASVAEAKLWGIRDANLYNLVVTLKDSGGNVVDKYSQRFGFRFLSVEDYGGENVRLYLNGKRVFLLSSISWGFWPVNGIFPTPELARKHVEDALTLGQNMLNFHRCEGNTLVLDAADEIGLLYYEEPGGYSSSRVKDNKENAKVAKEFQLATELNSQRFLRMVKRDRNHPSLVIYNMVNEPGWKPDERTKQDMAAAHLLDPTRCLFYGSGFMNPVNDEPQKLHMIPYDQTQRTVGYVDIHNAGKSPGVYVDSMYNAPGNFSGNTVSPREIFVWGEEGALASPPQLELIQKDLAAAGRNGWDGADYKDWHRAYADYFRDKKLEKFYPSMTELITTLGDIQYYEHGRMLENVRIADDADLYVLNGYEDMKFDNFSGAVDVFRNLKGHPELIAQYMRPLMVAVKARDKIGEVGDTNLLDLFVLNNLAIPAGEYTVRARVKTPAGGDVEIFSGKVKVSGGDKFSDLVNKEPVPVKLDAGTGYYNVTAELLSSSGEKLADGHDEIFAVDWKSDKIAGKGAVLGGGGEMLRFAKEYKQADIVPYSDALGKLDYLIVGAIDAGEAFKTISPFSTRAADGKTIGLNLDYFRGKASFDQTLDRRVSTAKIDFDTKSKIIPGYDILGETDFTLRWEGFIVSDASGVTKFVARHDDGAKIWLDGKLVVDDWKNGPSREQEFEINMEAGKPCPIKIEAYQAGGGWEFSLKWKPPVSAEKPDVAKLLERVKNDGTKLLLLESAEAWVKELQKLDALPAAKVFHPNRAWVGHSFFVREHPFFAALPVNKGMNWEYQRLVVYDGPAHFGLYDMKGEEAIVSLVGAEKHLVATSVGVVPCGKGQIVFSSLDLEPNLVLEMKASAVPKKIFVNILKWAGEK